MHTHSLTDTHSHTITLKHTHSITRFFSPSLTHSHTHSLTHRFAQRVSLIKNKASINEDLDPSLVIRRLKAEILTLREEIGFLKVRTYVRTRECFVVYTTYNSRLLIVFSFSLFLYLLPSVSLPYANSLILQTSYPTHHRHIISTPLSIRSYLSSPFSDLPSPSHTPSHYPLPFLSIPPLRARLAKEKPPRHRCWTNSPRSAGYTVTAPTRLFRLISVCTV